MTCRTCICLKNFQPLAGNYPLCTIAETPRLPEHCVEYAVVVLWEQRFPGQKLNRDRAAVFVQLNPQPQDLDETWHAVRLAEV